MINLGNEIYLYSTSRKNAIVVVFGFSHFNKDSPEVITHNGSTYLRGMLEPLPLQYASDFCSAREYTLLVDET